MATPKRPRLERVDHSAGLSLHEVFVLSKRRLVTLIDEETTHPNTRATWKIYLRILNHKFCTKSAVEFWSDNLFRMYNFLHLSINAQTLFLRMFTRMRKWRACNQIDESVMESVHIGPAVNELSVNGFVQTTEAIDFDALMKLPQVNDLREIAKKLKVPYSKLSKEDLIAKIKTYARTQGSLFSPGNMEARVIQIARDVIGECFCLDESFCTLLLAFLTVYCPTTMDSKQLFDNPKLVLQSNFYFIFGRFETEELVRHLEPEAVTRINIYQSIEQLFEYLEAVEIEKRIIGSMREDPQAVANMADDIIIRLFAFIATSTDDQGQLSEYYANIPDHHLRFTAPWIYVRCLHTCGDVYQRLKQHAKANEIFSLLIVRDCLKRFHIGERGNLYERLTLNFQFHLKDKDTSLKFCELALADALVPDKYKLMIQDRAMRLSKEFEAKIELEKWETNKIVGDVLKKNLGDGRLNRFIIKNPHTGGFDHCSVEEVALRYYLNNGYADGFHCEGRVWHMLYFLVFYDILFDVNVKSAWLSELQRDPLDRNTNMFFTNRQKAITDRIAEIEASPVLLESFAQLNYETKIGLDSLEADWTLFTGFVQIKEFLDCCPRPALLGIFSRFSQDNRHTRSGFPDLVVWNKDTKDFAVVEVKGPGDKLSTKQRLNLDFFVRNNVRAIVCHVEKNKITNR